jgi:hypothetical protein
MAKLLLATFDAPMSFTAVANVAHASMCDKLILEVHEQ